MLRNERRKQRVRGPSRQLPEGVSRLAAGSWSTDTGGSEPDGLRPLAGPWIGETTRPQNHGGLTSGAQAGPDQLARPVHLAWDSGRGPRTHRPAPRVCPSFPHSVGIARHQHGGRDRHGPGSCGDGTNRGDRDAAAPAGGRRILRAQGLGRTGLVGARSSRRPTSSDAGVYSSRK